MALDPNMLAAGVVVLGSVAGGLVSRKVQTQSEQIARLRGELDGLRQVVIAVIQGQLKETNA